MKKIYIVLGLLMSLALGMSARTFTGGEIIYVKKNPANWDWYGNTDTDGKFAYFFNNGNSDYAWSTVATGVWYCSDVLQIIVPAGNWTHVVLTRNSVKENPKWSNVYNNGDDSKVNKTEDIALPDNQNYLDNFRQFKDKDSHSGDMWHWSDCYFYRPTDDPTSASVTKIDQADREVIKVCKQSAGDPFSLQPRLISPSAGYDYDQGRTWFKWDGSKWVEIRYANYKWGFDGADGLNETIGADESHTYYFLSTSNHAKQRFIEIAVTEDCSPTCEITDFGVVTSNVNAHDSTYVLDGIVAFKDANGKTLRISVTDSKGEHHVDYVNPSTPHIFSLPGLFADGKTGLYATASFLETSYSQNSNFYDAPNAIEAINTKNINTTHGEATTITPDYPGTGGFKWNDGNTSDHVRTIPAYGFDTTIIYTYYEYETAPEVPGNLIVNGDFSNAGFNYGDEKRQKSVVGCNISDYNFWGKDIPTSSNFYNDYTDPLSGDYLTGGLAVVTDANQFWKRFTKRISSKTGDHFALFDADNSGEKAAWKIETGATYPNLKLAKGTNYMFSFWVANINNYGEMNNAAKLQFEISYSTDGGGSWSTPEKLGSPIDLNDYPDNLWHQNSYVYVAPEDANNVRISVKDLNTSTNPGGNDFALDDIKFQAISVVSQAIKHCQRFVVNIYEAPCTFSSIKIDTIRPKCSDANKNQYSLRVTLKYDKPQGKLTVTDNIYGEIYSETTVSEPTTKVITINNLAADGKTHTLTAKFTKPDAHNVDKGCETSGSFVAPGTPALSVTMPTVPAATCDITTFSLDVTTTLAYQNGTQLLYYWDNVLHPEATQTISYGPSSVVNSTLTGLVYDGKPHSLVVRTNNSTHDCEASISIPAVPYMPSVTVNSAVVQNYACGAPTYAVEVTASFTNSQGQNLIFEDWNGTKQSVATPTNSGTVSSTFTGYAWDATPISHTYNVYFEGAEGCSHTQSFTSQVAPTLTVTPKFIYSCDVTTYSLRLILDYTNQRGNYILANVDGAADKSQANQYKSQMTAAKDSILIDGLIADGKPHTYDLRFDDTNDCQKLNVSFTAPYSPQITSATAIVQSYKCGSEQTQYQVKVEVEFVNGQGHDLIIEDWNGRKDTIKTSASDTKKEQTFSYNWETPATHTYKVYFSGVDDPCKTNHMPSFTSPAEPKIENIKYTIPDAACNSVTYDVTVTFDYYNQDGAFSVDIDGTPATSITPIVPNDANKQSATAIFTGLPADGGTGHVLTVQTTGGTHNCLKTENITGVPALPRINSVTQSLTPDYTCGDTQCHVTLTVDYTNALGKNINVKESGSVIKFVPAKTGAGTSQETIPLDFDFGTTHSLTVYFDGREECAVPVVVTMPSEPKTNVAWKIVNTDCDKTTYDIEVEIKYTNRDGALQVDVDGVAASSYTPAFQPNDNAEQTLIAKVNDLPADGATHVINVAFTGGKHGCPVAPITFTAPYSPQITSVKADVKSYKCGNPNYQVEVTVTYTNAQDSDLVITDEAGHSKTLKSTDTEYVSPAKWTFDMPWESPVASHTVKAYFVGAESCKDNASHKDTYTSPAEPKIENIKYTIPDAACNSVTYDVKVTFDYYNQDGAFSVDIDGTPATSITPIVPNDANKQSATATFTGLPADGGTGHVLTVQTTGGTHNCLKTENITGVPALPRINSVTQSLTPDYTCGDTQCHVTLTVDYTNALGKNINVKESGSVIKFVPAKTGAGTSQETIPLDFDFGTTHSLTVYFDGREECAVPVVVTMPSEPKTNVAWKIVNTDCDKTTYDIEVEIKYTNRDGALQVDVDGVAASSYTPAFQPNDNAEQTLIAKVNDLPADGATHVINVAFTGGKHGCPVAPITFTAPYSPQITSATATVQPYNCGNTQYQVKVEVGFANGQGQDLIIEDWNGKKDTIKTAASDTKKEQTFSYNWETPATHTYKIYFKGVEDKCKTNHMPSFTSPAEPKLENVALTVPTSLSCNAKTFDLTVTFDYCNQDGTFGMDLDGLAPTSITPAVTTNTTSVTSVTAVFKNLTADGTTGHTLTVGFTGGTHSCRQVQQTVTMPLSPVIDAVVVKGVPTKVPCGTKEYDVSVEISTPFNATGQQITLFYSDNGVTKDTTVNATGILTTVKLKLHDFDSTTPMTMQAAYTFAPTCKKPSGSYTVPEHLTCVKYYESICEGGSFYKYGYAIDNPPVGLNIYANPISITDTLFLTVVEMPKLTIGKMAATCDNESTIRIPFTGTTGLADTIDISIGSNNYIGTIVGSDITFTRAAELVAGDYSGIVTIGTKGIPCVTTYPVSFSIALGGTVFSKWSDVLFVDNKDGKFVSYQWYENGVMMSGETMQRLYRPEGLPGAYYCQLITTDGKTINTCEQTFDKVQPSRSADQAASSKVVRKYRVSPHVYIIQTETDGIIETKKILTPYE